MDKRYQVFVSSTYEDLREERSEVMLALLKLRCIPAGMELFPAENDEQWNVIKRTIDESDYYVVIIGGRYGTTMADGVSYTEREYRYAVETGKPVLVFIREGDLLAKHSESDPEKRVKLEEFRRAASAKAIVSKWRTAHELGREVLAALVNEMNQRPGVGWIRASDTVEKDEALRLRTRIDELQSALNEARTEPPAGADALSGGDDKIELVAKVDTGYSATEHSFPITWNELFHFISPMMIDEASDEDLRRRLGDVAKEWLADEVDSTAYTRLTDESFDTVIIQFRALGLIQKSQQRRSLKDRATYWTLTPYGDTVMMRLRAIPRIPRTKLPAGGRA